MNDAFAPAISALQQELDTIQKKAREIKSAINTLCQHAGIDELYAIDEDGPGSLANIRADSFYGKTIGTAAREYLEMRKASNLGPATSKEIFEGLVSGGFHFEAASDTNAQISLSNTLRKNSRQFHKLPNGQYGLLAWYPNAKSTKQSVNDEADQETDSATDQEPVAEVYSSDVSSNDQEADASEPQNTEDR